MFNPIINYVDFLFGFNEKTSTMFQMSMRAFVVYLLGLIIIRINHRFIGIRAQYNIILQVIFGSLMSQAILPDTPFFSLLVAVLTLVCINGILARISFYFPRAEKMLEGQPIQLVENGKINWNVMKYNAITEQDLRTALRAHSQSNDISIINEAYFETDGKISIITKK